MKKMIAWALLCCLLLCGAFTANAEAAEDNVYEYTPDYEGEYWNIPDTEYRFLLPQGWIYDSTNQMSSFFYDPDFVYVLTVAHVENYPFADYVKTMQEAISSGKINGEAELWEVNGREVLVDYQEDEQTGGQMGYAFNVGGNQMIFFVFSVENPDDITGDEAFIACSLEKIP